MLAGPFLPPLGRIQTSLEPFGGVFLTHTLCIETTGVCIQHETVALAQDNGAITDPGLKTSLFEQEGQYLG